MVTRIVWWPSLVWRTAGSGKRRVLTKAPPANNRPLCLPVSPMNDATTPRAPSPSQKKPLDTVVKLALMVLFGSFTLIWGGMYLSRPDRTIPPYSVGSQVGPIVATHVPRDTTDQGVETLLKRFRKVGRKTHHFASMKIQPTTPGDPGGWYRRIVVYVFDDYGWTEPEMLKKYLDGDASVVKKFEKS